LNIAIIGLGYVGCVSAACLASAGHNVIGVDISPEKVDLINAGKSPIIEKDIDELVSATVEAGKLSATSDIAAAISKSDLSMICVGTPSRANGSLDLKYIRNSVADVAIALKAHADYHVVTIRSTMLPGTLENVVLPLLEEKSGKKVGNDIGFTLVGAWDAKSAAPVQKVYANLDQPFLQVDIRVAEMVKYSCNIFHALKVGFANEIGVMCKALQIDSHQVMDIFKQDTELNISTSYLTPGFAFGGSCLPKDLRAVTHKAKELDVSIPILDSILPSNQIHIDRAFKLVQQTGCKKIGILGLSFKAGTDDLRESPIVQLAEQLLGKGYEIAIYDANVIMANLLGANKQFIEQVIPHLAKLLNGSLDSVIDSSDVLILGQNLEEFDGLQSKMTDKHHVIDLVRALEHNPDAESHYQGICW